MGKKIVWLVASCLIVSTLLLVSCEPAVTDEEEVLTEEGVVQPEETEPSPDCPPYKVVFAQAGSRQSGVSCPSDLPEILEISMDFGKEVTLEEADVFRDQVYLVDIEGVEGILFGVATSPSTWLTAGDKAYEFGPVVTFKFYVQWRSRECTFKFKDCPWGNLGNPFLDIIVYD